MRLLDLKELESKDKNTCRGLFFRANCTTYFHNNILCRKVSLKLLKRMSCKGCERCFWLFTDFEEMSEDYGNALFDHVKNGKIYTPVVINISRDYETGYWDDYDIEMREVKEEKLCMIKI